MGKNELYVPYIVHSHFADSQFVNTQFTDIKTDFNNLKKKILFRQQQKYK